MYVQVRYLVVTAAALAVGLVIAAVLPGDPPPDDAAAPVAVMAWDALTPADRDKMCGLWRMSPQAAQEVLRRRLAPDQVTASVAVLERRC